MHWLFICCLVHANGLKLRFERQKPDCGDAVIRLIDHGLHGKLIVEATDNNMSCAIEFAPNCVNGIRVVIKEIALEDRGTYDEDEFDGCYDSVHFESNMGQTQPQCGCQSDPDYACLNSRDVSFVTQQPLVHYLAGAEHTMNIETDDFAKGGSLLVNWNCDRFQGFYSVYD